MEKIDKLLQNWARKQNLDDDKLGLLTENICRQVKHFGKRTYTLRPQTNFIPLLGLRITYGCLGVALVCFLLIITRRPPLPPSQTVSVRDLEYRQLTLAAADSQEHSKNEFKILQELNRVFPGNLRWIQTSNHSLEMGLASESIQTAISSDYVLLHIIVFKKQAGKSWEKAWTTQLAAVPEEVILTEWEAEPGGSIRFWTHRLPDGLLMVDSDIKLKLDVELNTSFSKIFRPEKPERILWLKTGDAEYCIFETVNQLRLQAHSLYEDT